MDKRWGGLCLMLMMVWMLLPVAQAANDGSGTLLNLTGNTTIGIESIGPSSPPDWYEFTVTVQDEEGNPLEGVVIRLHPVLADGTLGAAITGTDGRYMTDQNGQQKYRIPPPGGVYQLQTEFAGYEHYTSVEFQIAAHGSMVVTLRKQQDQAGQWDSVGAAGQLPGDGDPAHSQPPPRPSPHGGNTEAGNQGGEEAQTQCHWHWYILICIIVSMVGTLGRLWYLHRLQRAWTDEAQQLEETGARR